MREDQAVPASVRISWSVQEVHISASEGDGGDCHKEFQRSMIVHTARGKLA